MTTDIWVALGAIGTFLAALAALIPVLRRKPKKVPDEAVGSADQEVYSGYLEDGRILFSGELLKRIQVERG